MEAGTKYIGTAITLNEFFIDVTSGTATKDLQRRFIHFNGDGDSFDMGLRINCNFFIIIMTIHQFKQIWISTLPRRICCKYI
ncbi:MAG: hypothetical protein IPI22_05040 [Bacteroidetes bacterium]|nr:hypothetical protein [Bacteroidota bacterium]